tara:strand:+ start:105 stop:731 length:627 start_codon:yes stop_codon:yes gene_type:complete
MQKNQLFVFLIIIIMPLSGCFGGSEEVADVTETTVINHYHYNNTTIIHETNESSDSENSENDTYTHYNNSTYVDNYFTNNTYVENYYTNNSNYTETSHETIMIYSQGGVWNGGPAGAFILNTSEGDLVQILESSWFRFGNPGYLTIETDCGIGGQNPTQIQYETTLEPAILPYYLPGSSMDCTHSWEASGTSSWSIVYAYHSNATIVI